MKKIMVSSALVLAALVGVSGGYAAGVSTTADPASFTQIIQMANLLANTNLDSTDSTAAPVNIEFFIGSARCWDTGSRPVNFKNHYSFGTCPSCGCRADVTKVVITPLPTRGRQKAAYSPYTVDINHDSRITATQMVILQDQVPVFNPQSGEIDQPGTIKIKRQEQ
jgi:hypothetical protein